jgi:hypothetical protein
MTLYDISDEIRAILNAADDGELTEQQVERLGELVANRDAKIDAICAMIAETEGEEGMIAKEQERLAARKLSVRNKRQRLKQMILDDLAANGETKYKTKLFTTWTQVSQDRCVMDVPNAEDLDDEFRGAAYVPSMKKANDYLAETGHAPDGFKVVAGEKFLRIR